MASLTRHGRNMLAWEAELQKLVDLPPNLKFMVSTFLILTQYKIT